MTETTLIPVPGKPRVLKTPKIAEGKLGNGLRVLVVLKPSVPRVEARMFLPVGGKGSRAADRVLADTLTTGTSTRGAYEIAQELQRLGGEVGASVDADNMHVGGSVLSVNLERFFGLVTEFMTDATFPADELAVARDRIVQTVAIQRSQPEVVAQEALLRRLFGKHAYGRGLPEPEAVAKIGRAAASKRYREVAVPRGGVLVLVGDVNPPKTIELVANALSKWKGRSSGVTEAPSAFAVGPTLIVDRPGSVQTNIRLAGSVPSPDSADAAAFEVANTIFGGYFISRLVANLRERNGYTYSPRSGVAHRRLASYVQIAAEVGTEVTIPSLVETHYELGRMVGKDVEESELTSAQRYVNGILSIRMQSQAGLASTLASVVMHGLGVEYLREHPRRIAAVTLEDVRDASRRYLAPSKLVTVLVGDASKIASDVATLTDVEVQAAPGA